MEFKKLSTPEKSQTDKILNGLDVVLQLIPYVGGASASLVQLFRDTDEEERTTEWRLAIEENLEAIQLAIIGLQKENKPLSPLAQSVGLLVCANCSDGSEFDSVSSDDLANSLSESENNIQKCAYELEVIGLVRTSMTTQSFDVSPTQLLYEKMDKPVFGWDTIEDSVAIAEYCLTEEVSDAPSVQDNFDWSLRRFNPAFVSATQLIPDRLIRKVDGVDYVVYGFADCSEAKAALNKFVTNNKQLIK